MKPFTRAQLGKILGQIKKAASKHSRAGASHAAAGNGDRMASPKTKILLAEDNAANVATLMPYLEAKGYEITVACNGEEAIQLAHESNPELVLMDVQMPKMDGLQAMTLMQKDPNLSEIPIIALTALAMPGDRERCLKAGATDYLSKPVSLRQLHQTIQQLLEREVLAS